MNDFNILRNRAFLGSFSGVALGTVLYFTPANSASTWVVGASLGAIAASEILITASERTYTKKAGRFESEIAKLTLSLNAERDFIVRQKKQLNDTAQALTDKANAYNSLHQQAIEMQLLIAGLKQEVVTKHSQLESFHNLNAHSCIELLTESFGDFKNQLINLINSLSKRYPTLNKQWQELIVEYEKLIEIFNAQVDLVLGQKIASELIEMSLALQHEIISKGATLKIKAYKSVVTHLSQQLQEVIPIEEHERFVAELNSAWQAKNQTITQTYQQNFEAIKSEFTQVANSVVTGYRSDFKEVIDQGMSQTEQIEALQLEIVKLQQALQQASKPYRFPAAVEQSRVGNAIIDFYYRAGICLDAIDWDDTETGYKLLFHVGRNGSRFISADVLNVNDAPQKLKELSGAINTPEFKPNVRGGHMVLEIQTRRAPKKQLDITKLAKPVNQFSALVSRWRRVRITGGSEAGKSPTAENLAICILKSINGPSVIKFYDPMHDSGKNYRSIPACGTSHQDSANGLREMEQVLIQRSQGTASRDVFYLAWFDEVDTTLNKFDVGGDLLNIIKQASHQNMGVIVTGQNSNTKKFKGFDRSDFNNMVSLHIGDDYLNVLANRLDDHPNKAELLDRGNKLTQWCDEQNQEYGLTRSDPNAYRFALVVEPGKMPFYMLLPEFGCYTYLDVVASNNLKLETTENTFVAGNVATEIVDIRCSCGSSNIKRNGKTGGKQKYHCHQCGRNWIEQ